MTNLNEIQHMIDAAVLKGQIELTESLYRQVVKGMNKANTQPAEYESLHAVLHVIGRVNYNYRKQLNNVATTEVSDQMTELMKDANDEMQAIIDGSPAAKYFTEGDVIREQRMLIIRNIDREFKALKMILNKGDKREPS